MRVTTHYYLLLAVVLLVNGQAFAAEKLTLDQTILIICQNNPAYL